MFLLAGRLAGLGRELVYLFAEYPTHSQYEFFSMDSKINTDERYFILIHTNINCSNCTVTFHVSVLSETWIADELEWIEIPGFSAFVIYVLEHRIAELQYWLIQIWKVN